jgi:hypothetical protein
MVSKVDRTVDHLEKKADNFQQFFFFFKGATVATSRLSTLGVNFLPFFLPLHRRESPKKPLVLSPMSTVDYVADQRSDNS